MLEAQLDSPASAAKVSIPLRMGEWIWIAAAAILLRGIIFGVVMLRSDLSLNQYARLYDGNSYLITAAAMLGDRTQFDDFNGRVFPGFPALIAICHLSGFPLAAAAVGIDWISAAAAAALAGILFADRRVGWGMVMLFPHYLMNSALALSEAPLLAFTLSGLVLIRGRGASKEAGGALIGIAGLIRPMACFALLGGAVSELFARPRLSIRNRAIQCIALSVSAGAVVLAGMLLVQHWRGDALAGARYYANSPNTYDGQLLTWPFHSLLTTPGLRHVPSARVLYIWAHAVLALIACGLLLRPMIQRPIDQRDALAGPWLLTNTLFALCVGSIWGFECFHRFLIPALPAMLWALRAALPKRPVGWLALSTGSMAIAMLTIIHDLGRSAGY